VLGAECEARTSSDIEAFSRRLTEDVRWHVPGDNALAGVYRGIDDVMAYVRVRQMLAGGTLRLTVDAVLANERVGCVLVSGSAEIGGSLQRWRAHGIYSYRDGKIAECWVVPQDQGQFDRIWAEQAG
jgi:ketosteroid isomerase-like protein